MEVVDRKPVPVYEAVCAECKSTIRYKACEVDGCVIKCPVCNKVIWASTCNPVAYEESEEVGKND